MSIVFSTLSENTRSDCKAQKYRFELLKFSSSKRILFLTSESNMTVFWTIEPVSMFHTEQLRNKLTGTLICRSSSFRTSPHVQDILFIQDTSQSQNLNSIPCPRRYRGLGEFIDTNCQDPFWDICLKRGVPQVTTSPLAQSRFVVNDMVNFSSLIYLVSLVSVVRALKIPASTNGPQPLPGRS